MNKQNEGLKIYSDGYRSGARLSSSKKVCLEDRMLYVKWKCEDGYSLMSIVFRCIMIKTDMVEIVR
jgi:hypothetical protein